MIKMVFGFIPWILFTCLLGTSLPQLAIATIAALLSVFIFDWKGLKNSFILPWCSIIFFLLLLASTLVISEEWLVRHANLLANAAIFSISLISLIINSPFSIQYAKQSTPEIYWTSPTFIRINQIITLVWTLSFGINLVISLYFFKRISVNSNSYQLFAYLPTIAAIAFTKVFPRWYKNFSNDKKIVKAKKAQGHNKFLKGNFAPVRTEIDATDLEIIGQVPLDLNGVYMRNGPNPEFAPFSYTYPFDGDGMIHAIFLKNGKASYKNRFIVTDQLQTERNFGEAIYGGVNLPIIKNQNLLSKSDSQFPVKIGRFIHILRYANTYLALHESFSAMVLDKELNTLHEWNPTNLENPLAVNAHSKQDPITGEIVFISYHDEPIITYQVFDKNLQLMINHQITLTHSFMIHDFVLTQKYIVVFLCPVILNISSRVENQSFPSWQPELGTKVLIINRKTFNYEIYETEAFFVYHFANAYDDNQEIIIDFVRYQSFSDNIGQLYRTKISLTRKTCAHQLINEMDVEFPRMNENLVSLPYTYAYLVGNPHQLHKVEKMTSIVKMNVTNNQFEIHDFGVDYEVGECVFIPKQCIVSEDDGYLICFIYNKVLNQSEFIILNAKNMKDDPLARIKLTRRIPYGLHGSWMPDD